METLIGKYLKLGGRIYKICTECTPETHPNTFRHSKAKHHIGVQGARGALGIVSLWEVRAHATWLHSGGRNQDYQSYEIRTLENGTPQA